MKYSIRSYEAVQRLFWFVFFLACLAVAYPLAGLYGKSYDGAAVSASIRPEVLKTANFWTQRYWLGVDPLGNIILYLLLVVVLFLAGKLAWLLLQYVGKHVVKNMLAQPVKNSPNRSESSLEGPSANRQRSFSVEPVLNRVRRFPLGFFFHSFQRLRLMLANHQEVLSSEELVEKERRVQEIDWQVYWSSWAPFRWLLWILLLLALVQTCWLFYLQVVPALGSQTEIEGLLGPVLASLLPIVQIIFLIIFFNLVSGLLRRLENLHLSNVDALFYDQLVSRVPFQSSDTPIILEALQKQFNQLHAILQRMEQTAQGRAETDGPEK